MNLTQLDKHLSSRITDRLDQKLVTRIQKGDRMAFDLLLVKYQSRVASLVSRYVASQQEIVNITQTAFIKAYRSIHGFKGDSSFNIWLFRIVINHAHSVLQENQSNKRAHVKTGKQAGHNTFVNLDKPDHLLSQSELIEVALSVMSPDLSITLMLRVFNDFSYKEISQVMNCPVETVRTRIFRACELCEDSIRSRCDMQAETESGPRAINERIKESLSALLDGEVNELELQRILSHDNRQEVTVSWHIYHHVRELIQYSQSLHVNVDIRSSVMGTINIDEPPHKA